MYRIISCHFYVWMHFLISPLNCNWIFLLLKIAILTMGIIFFTLYAISMSIQNLFVNVNWHIHMQIINCVINISSLGNREQKIEPVITFTIMFVFVGQELLFQRRVSVRLCVVIICVCVVFCTRSGHEEVVVSVRWCFSLVSLYQARHVPSSILPFLV